MCALHSVPTLYTTWWAVYTRVCVCGEGVVHGFTLMGKVVVAGCEPRLHKKRKN